MIEPLIRSLWATSWRKARGGSRAWTVVAAAVGGVRLLRRVTRDRDEVLYRTRVMPGDQFEISATPPTKKKK